MSGDDRSLYEVLGVGDDSSAAEIKAGWRRMLLIVHPDHGGSSAATREVQAAYTVLSDPVRRCGYDQLFTARRESTGAQGAGGDSTSSWSFRFDLDDLLRDMERAAAAARQAAARRAEAEESARRAAAARKEAARQAAARTAATEEAARRAQEQATRNQTTWDSTHASSLFCLATTRKGYPCMAQRQKSSQFCYNHDPIRYRSHHGSRTSSTSAHSAGPSPSAGARTTSNSAAATPSTYPATSSGAATGCIMVLLMFVMIGAAGWWYREAIADFVMSVVSWTITLMLLWAFLKFLTRKRRRR